MRNHPTRGAKGFNRNSSAVAIVLMQSGSKADFGSPERTKMYVRKPKSVLSPGMRKNSVTVE
jgi:hypothetical protein